MWKVRELADKVTNVVMNYTDIEAKVREATNDDPWGPTGTIRHELAQATFSYDQFPEVMGMLWKRIAENKRSPRRIYKSLLLVHHLLLNGSDRVIRATTDRLYEIRQLQDYHVVYEPGFNLSSIIPVDEYKDGEMNVRVKAKEIVELVQDEERLREDRKKSKKNRDKYVGIGSDRSMSKWNDFDDDLQFPRQSSSSSKFDDFDGDDDNSSPGGSKSKSTSNNKESPKSINVKLRGGNNEDDEDFNPRATEDGSHSSNSFHSLANKKGAAGKASPTTTTHADGGDFADFQSAFGSSGATSNSTNHGSSATHNNTRAIHESQDLFNPGPPSPQHHHPHHNQSSSNLNSTVDLLGLDMSPSILSSTSAAQTQHVIGSNSSATLSSSFDAFQGFQLPTAGIPAGGSQQGQTLLNLSGGPAGATSGPLTFQSAHPTFFQPFQQQHHQATPVPQQQQQQQQQHVLFGSPSGAGDHFGELLQPQQVNNINNNHVHHGASLDKGPGNDKKTLEGTTWSDLNFSMDDLSLSAKAKPTARPTMNQLLSK